MSAPHLFSPLDLRSLTVRNRVWIPPMCQYSAASAGPELGVPNDWHAAHWGALGRGGAGLVVVEATAVLPEGRISPNCLGLWNDAQEAAFARMLPFAKAHGARFAIQLGHAGRKASTWPWLPGAATGTVPLEDGGWETVGPSELAFGDYTAPRALRAEELDGIVEAFAASADRAVRAGFDAIEIHGAHGYLLQSFLSPLANTRDDAYGGSPENRARLLRRIVRRVRADHPETPLLVRISAEEWTDGGFRAEDAAQLGVWLAEDGVDVIDVSTGGGVADARIPVGPSYQVPVAALVRDAVRGARDAALSGTTAPVVAAVGMITSPDQAESVLVTGRADAVFVGRPALANPHLPAAWAQALRFDGADTLIPGPYHRARF